MSEFEYGTGKPSGWVCPICGRVFAPWVPECTWHNSGLTNMYPATQIDTPIRDFMVNPKLDNLHKESITKPETGDGDYYKHLTK